MHIILYQLLEYFLQDVSEAEGRATELTQTCPGDFVVCGGPRRWEQTTIAKPKHVQSRREKDNTKLGSTLQRVAEV